MVVSSKRLGRRVYRCEACGFHYLDEATAKKCEAWCREHNSCNIQITKEALENQPSSSRGLASKSSAVLGVFGCLSCYLGHFPLALVGLAGLIGISASGSVSVLNAYAASPFFLPILVISILLLIASAIPSGRIALLLAAAAGAAILVSMTVYLEIWLFITGFLLLAAARTAGVLRMNPTARMREILLSAAPFIVIATLLGMSAYFAAGNAEDRQPAGSGPPMMRMER